MSHTSDPEDFIDLETIHDPVSRRMRERRQKVEEMTLQHMQELEREGGLRHLHGKPLQLDDDPNWLATKVLKQAGFSHPLIEQRRELLRPLGPVQQRVSSLERQRAWLTGPDTRATGQDATVFNTERRRLFATYRATLDEVNRDIRDYNLRAPESLHELPIRVDREMARVEEMVPEVDPGELDGRAVKRRRRGLFGWFRK